MGPRQLTGPLRQLDVLKDQVNDIRWSLSSVKGIVCPRLPPPAAQPTVRALLSLMCQCHGSRFDVTNGTVLKGPASDPLATYPVREQDGEIQVAI
jgi:hypothetical protein